MRFGGPKIELPVKREFCAKRNLQLPDPGRSPEEVRHPADLGRRGSQPDAQDPARHGLLQGALAERRVVSRHVPARRPCATLADWFDQRRLRDDYVPTGFKGYGVTTRAVKGHLFGLKLSQDDKRALIAFLKTL